MFGVALLIALAAAAAPAAPDETPDSLFARALGANRYALALEGERLAGPGAAFLVSSAAGTQFFVLGEDHNVAEIPPLTAALFPELHEKYGYDYFADEQDVWMCAEISKPPYVGSE